MYYVSDYWEVQDYVPKIKEFRKKHTAQNVGEFIQDILDVYSIKRESVIAVTTDNAASYINAVERHLKTVNIQCVAHTINLAAY